MNEIVEKKAAELQEILKADLEQIEKNVTTKYTLADAIREGSLVTTQAHGWGDGETACALSAAYIAAKARGFVK